MIIGLGSKPIDGVLAAPVANSSMWLGVSKGITLFSFPVNVTSESSRHSCKVPSKRENNE